MSKQYLTTHTIDNAHLSDIFSFAVTSNRILTVSGASSIKVYDTTSTTDVALAQDLPGAHKLGCHHIVTSRNGKKAASAGFGGEVKIWAISEAGEWEEEKKVVDNNKAGETWAIALSEDGQHLASTTYDGRINVWDLVTDTKTVEYETKGSFGMCVDISRDGRYTASGHENGAVYVFDNETRRMKYSLPGMVKPVRTVAFSPLGSLLAAGGDARTIALYDVKNGEQVMNLTGHSAWIFSLDWSDTGDYLLSGSFDGKVKVWAIDRRACVYTHSGDEKTLWCVKWLPKTGKSEVFAIAGANRSITFFREATGG